MLQAFSGWGDAVRLLLECIAEPSLWALHELDELPGYVHGRVGLIGDAAHAMLPHQGAGAGQGLEDAWLLARLLADPRVLHCNAKRVLEVYDAIRRPRACQVQRTSWEAGELYEFRDRQIKDQQARLSSTLASLASTGYGTTIWRRIWQRLVHVSDGAKLPDPEQKSSIAGAGTSTSLQSKGLLLLKGSKQLATQRVLGAFAKTFNKSLANASGYMA